MITVKNIIDALDMLAPPALQEDYDNAGLLTGNKKDICTGVLICLDCTPAIVEEAIAKKCNLIVAHHPIIFKGLKSITGRNYVEQTIIAAIKNDISIFAIHTNLDNVLHGVNKKIADKLKLTGQKILTPKKSTLRKLAVFVPEESAEKVLDAMFAAGGGHIGKYSECHFSSVGEGSFLPGETANPKVGEKGLRNTIAERKLEILFPYFLENQVLSAMKQSHPYEEVAYDIFTLENSNQEVGSGMIGYLPEPISEREFLSVLLQIFGAKGIRHTAYKGKMIQKIALCGGAGSFLLKNAITCGADAYVTSDVKYHEFFDAEGKILFADIGHYESEQYTVELIFDYLTERFPNFALQKTGVNTNPVLYFKG